MKHSAWNSKAMQQSPNSWTTTCDTLKIKGSTIKKWKLRILKYQKIQQHPTSGNGKYERKWEKTNRESGVGTCEKAGTCPTCMAWEEGWGFQRRRHFVLVPYRPLVIGFSLSFLFPEKKKSMIPNLWKQWKYATVVENFKSIYREEIQGCGVAWLL